MSNYSQIINEICLQSLANVRRLFYGKRRATNALETHGGPEHQPTKGLSIMPLIPVTALSCILQGHAL